MSGAETQTTGVSIVGLLRDRLARYGLVRAAPTLPARRRLTLLFVDIVASTEFLARIGDEQWDRLLALYRAAVRRELARFGGHEVDAAGDGFFVSFESPASATCCAQAIGLAVQKVGLTIRVGLHCGECQTGGEKICGLNVHAAARVMGAARPGEILVTGALKQMLAGSGLEFRDCGSFTLKGVPGEWQLYAVSSPPQPPEPPADQPGVRPYTLHRWRRHGMRRAAGRTARSRE